MSSLSLTPRRYAFVVPRFGEGIAGGAETLIGTLAAKIAARGDHVEVLTTCARDNRTWANEFPPGDAVEYGLRVRRFPVNERDLEKWIPLQIAIADGMRPSIDDQLVWMEHSVNSSALYAHIGAHAQEFDALFFGPYLFGTTFWGSLIAPERSYLIPCLHDEHYAYIDVIQSMFHQVAGAIFNSKPEQDLAMQLYGGIRGGEVGMGFEAIASSDVAALDPYFKDSFPYILYVGRKETGKNAQLLIDYFIALKDRGGVRGDLKLVIAGGGSFSDLHRPDALKRGDILDLEHLSEIDKRRLIKHALVLCQPSVNESFSIVLMESWLLNTPVLVHGSCPVTRQHAVDSGGGLFFTSAEDFIGVITTLLSRETLRGELAAAGKRYVTARYSWDAVSQRFDAVIGELLEQSDAGQNQTI